MTQSEAVVRKAARRLSSAEPVTELRRIQIVESGEDLVDFLEHCPSLRMDRPRFTYKRETVVRRSVADMLCVANRSMPPGYQIAIVEGWRPPHIQRRMYQMVWNHMRGLRPELSDVSLKRLVNRFSAPMNERVPPPHTTGGAVDLALIDANGQPFDVTSPYDGRDPVCYAFSAPGLSEAARRNRQILHDALVPAGLTNYPSEYWHWSHGDQGWAYRGGHPRALYAAIQPEGWLPNPDDDIAAPLEFLNAD